MHQYLNLMQTILDDGIKKGDRTGTGTLSLFGTRMEFDLSESFPLVTTKKIHWKSMVYELLWFMQGRIDVKWLQDRRVRIWNEWAKEDGTIGPGYGKQWRSWPAPVWIPGRYEGDDWVDGHYEMEHIDQLQVALDKLRNKPNDRRNIVSAWNVGQIEEMGLPPCHLLFQFYVAEGRLSCQMYQRSCDFFLGVPFNIASYALLTEMMAHMAGLEPGKFIWVGGDTHLYLNHLDQAREQLSRTPLPEPMIQFNREIKELDQWEFEDIELIGYQHHPAIKAKVAV